MVDNFGQEDKQPDQETSSLLPQKVQSYFQTSSQDAISFLQSFTKQLFNPITLTLAGWGFTYYNNRLNEERKARIDWINQQLRDFYGPLLACVTASESAYQAMLRQLSPDGTRESLINSMKQDPSGSVASGYRHWMKSVLQPLNEKAANVIMDHVDLIHSNRMNPSLLKLVAHVFCNRVMIQRWDEGCLEAWSPLSYPDELANHVRVEFAKMKQAQAMLLGIRKGLVSRL